MLTVSFWTSVRSRLYGLLLPVLGRCLPWGLSMLLGNRSSPGFWQRSSQPVGVSPLTHVGGGVPGSGDPVPEERWMLRVCDRGTGSSRCVDAEGL